MATQSAIPRRRAVLIAPASDVKKALKALESDADEVVLDLEDAVSPSAKDAARAQVVTLLGQGVGLGRCVSVRVNALTTQWGLDDLDALAVLGGRFASVVVPKVESSADIASVVGLLGGPDSSIGIQALIETPMGVRRVSEICSAAETVQSVIIGYADLGAALGRSSSAGGQHWIAIQDAVLVAARAANIQVVDGPYLGVADDAPFRDAAQWVRDLGFDGKWVIHPAQLEFVRRCFTPDAKAVDDARRVLEALAEASADGRGAVQLDGRMLDEAVAVAARRTLARIGLG